MIEPRAQSEVSIDGLTPSCQRDEEALLSPWLEAHPSRDVVSGEVGHSDVEYRGMGSERESGQHSGRTVMSNTHVVPRKLDQHCEARSGVIVIVGDQDAATPSSCGARCSLL